MCSSDLGEWVCNTSVEEITYDHIPVQTLQPPAVVRLVRSPVAIVGKHIGYVPGAGDEIPDALRAIGYQVTELKDAVPAAALSGYDAIVLGVRAVNANPVIREFMPALLQYAEAGGTLVLQYNTSFETATDRFTPHEMKLSRFRVTEEDAEVRFIRPDHPVLNVPNKITPEDFKGWVQERGLYFPGSWGPQFQPVISMNDAGEQPGDGAILVAETGKGHFVYTALSFFRQLPEGVPGAFRLFANLRPVWNLPGVPSRYTGIDLVIVRENTEDLYAGLEHQVVPGVVESLKIITERASTRIARFAFQHARKHGRKKVTSIHKANIMKLSDGLFQIGRAHV